MLAITADSAASNDVMVDELDERIETFDGSVNRARCFDHITNLVAKSLLRPFDIEPKKGAEDNDKMGAVLAEAEQALLELANGLDGEGLDLAAGDDDDADDNTEGWVDEVAELSAAAREELEAAVVPVKRLLVKVREESTSHAPMISCTPL